MAATSKRPSGQVVSNDGNKNGGSPKNSKSQPKYEPWTDQPRVCFKMPARRTGGEKPKSSFWGDEQVYNNRVMIHNDNNITTNFKLAKYMMFDIAP